MDQETENSSIDTVKTGSSKKSSIRNLALGWLGYLAVMAVVLFFFGPESWWQFGVSPEVSRKAASNSSLRDLNGGDWSYADHRGKVVVVNYWATWCPPCRFEMPGLVSVANEYQPRGVVMVGVTVDEDLTAVPPFIEKYQINFPILLAGFDPNISGEGMALPTTFLYDKEGRMAKKYTGLVLESTLRSDVEDLLREL